MGFNLSTIMNSRAGYAVGWVLQVLDEKTLFVESIAIDIKFIEIGPDRFFGRIRLHPWENLPPILL